jgi:hypothetical protein
MGIASTTKFIKNLLGNLTEEAALTTTAGAADAGRIPALNAGGVLDPTLLNATVSSGGVSAAGKLAQLDGAGRLDTTVLPVGIGPDTAAITASEALNAGDLINIWDNGGAAGIRKADASALGKEAHGFVLASVASGATGTVYFEGTNNQLSGLTPGVQFLSASTPGHVNTVAPTGAGKVVQRVGFATDASSMNFQAHVPIVLA